MDPLRALKWSKLSVFLLKMDPKFDKYQKFTDIYQKWAQNLISNGQYPSNTGRFDKNARFWSINVRFKSNSIYPQDISKINYVKVA